MEYLGAGSFGEVYKVFDSKLNRIVALKVLTAEPSFPSSSEKRKGDFDLEDAFLDESRRNAVLRDSPHPNIIQFYDVVESDEESLKGFTCEYVEGRTLEQVFEEQVKAGECMDEEKAVSIGMQIADGLCFASGRGILQRDLSLYNILLGEKGVIKIGDFGYSSITRRTLHSRPPETIEDNKNYDEISEIYSLGCDIYALCTNCLPFHEGLDLSQRREKEFREAVKKRKLSGELVPIRQKNPAISEELEMVVHKMTARNRENRHQSLEEVKEEFLDLKEKPLGIYFRFKRNEILTNPSERQEFLRRLCRKIDRWDIPEGIFPLKIEKDGKTWQCYPDITWNIGYLCGIYCEAYLLTKDKRYLEKAKEQARSLKHLKIYQKDQSTGSIFYFSFAQLYEILKRENENPDELEYYKKCALEASDSLCSRYDKKLGFIRAVDRIGKKGGIELFITTISEHLSLLWWASENSDNRKDRKKYRNIAIAQAEATLRYNVKDDYSVYMVSEIDTETGELIDHEDDKAGIAREQARGFAGFALAYKYTKDKRYLETAKKIEEQYSRRLGDKIIPPHDFDKPDNIKTDNFAAVTAGLGYILLSEEVPDESEKARHKKKLIDLTNALLEHVSFEQDYDGIVTHAPRDNTGKTNSLINVDYGFLYLQRMIIEEKN